MGFLAYTELVKLLTGIEERSLEKFFFTISKHSLTDLRFNTLKTLARLQRATVSHVLKEMKETSSGGTYISTKKFFTALEKDRILVREPVGRRTYWKFSEEAEDFPKYLQLKST